MEGDVFPLLIKILGAEDDLSIQVHPNNEYATET
ncbi:MAG: type I phosphomannose isomerase catalytic subunit [Eubacterium ventriosum]